MDHFNRRDGELYAEQIRLSDIARQVGTPTYVYSRATLERHWRAFDDALEGLDHLICYSVKALSNLAVLDVLAKLGSGFDVVSVGELERVLAVGGSPAKTVFSGVGKGYNEMARALEVGIHCFNVESESELLRLDEVARAHGVRAPMSLRVNPDVDAQTHPYISTGLKHNKFGVAHGDAERVYAMAADAAGIEVVGIDCHIGSQLIDVTPFVDALSRILELVEQLRGRGIELAHMDVGGGLGIRYRDEKPPEPRDYIDAMRPQLEAAGLAVHIEPGRAIAGNAGVFLTQIEYLKAGDEKSFAVVDGAMNDYIRPALYQAWCKIESVDTRDVPSRLYDVVGPVCESADFLGKDRELAISEGDYLALRSAGAYGFGMSSNYNSRTRAAEVMVDGDRFEVVRPREEIADLFATERMLDR
jgi:diaminopimelate decarboxylase